MGNWKADQVRINLFKLKDSAMVSVYIQRQTDLGNMKETGKRIRDMELEL